jgi:hypothetical protein
MKKYLVIAIVVVATMVVVNKVPQIKALVG